MTVGNLSPVLGTQFSDPLASFPESIFNLEGNNLEIVYGLLGNDNLSTNKDLTSSDEGVVLLGGQGDDQYLVKNDSFAVILETGNSNRDTLIMTGYKIDGDNTYSLIVDSRHLYTFDLDTETYGLILDWQSETVIDNFILSDGVFTFQEVTNFFNDLVANNDPNFLGDLTWNEAQTDPTLILNDAALDLSAIGLSSRTINGAINEIKATEANFQETIEIVTSGIDIEDALSTTDNSYIFNDGTYYYDFYSIEDLTRDLEPGDLVDIDLSSGAFDPLLFVLDSRGDVIEVTENAELTFVVGSGEPFFLSVESRDVNAIGSYNLSVNVIDKNEGDFLGATEPIVAFDTIGTNETINGSLAADDIVFLDTVNDEESFVDVYSLTGTTVGQEIRVDVDGDFNEVLGITVFDRDFNPVDDQSLIVNNNLAGNLGSGPITFTIEAGFDYFISVNSFDPGETGSYTLSTELI